MLQVLKYSHAPDHWAKQSREEQREERTYRYPTNPVSEEQTKYYLRTDLEVHSPPEGYIMAI